MKEYTVYWIKEEFAKHYYYKSDILYRFIKEYHLNQFRNDLHMQFHYITENFPKDALTSQLWRQPKNTLGKINSCEMLELGNKREFITLQIEEKHIKFRCETLQDAEALLFPTLRRFHPYLFIINSEYENYGWISPAKTITAYNNDQVLYS
ncbi:sporulation inhibitor of replication protein SirA [Ornithinibacillus sp. FSL M8-0202]|uniref:sporulation inhibitor of replication protein SirA n=1 Tax=Ornithinibacillus sp. FSL M8-0202 TaxID=2921616 RepID=UPI0030CF5D24